MTKTTGKFEALRAQLEKYHARIVAATETIEALAAKGIEPREYLSTQSDDEFRMSNAQMTLRIFNKHYADTLALFNVAPIA